MNTTFSFKRILQILRADSIEYDMNIIFYSIALLIGQVVLMSYQGNYMGTFNFLMICVAVGCCRFVGFKIHHSKGMFLTLPASTEEKFFAMLLEVLLIFIAYHILFGLAYFITGMFAEYPVLNGYNIYNGSLVWVSIGLFFFTLLIFCNTMARKRAFILFLFTVFFLLFVSAKSTMWMTENAENAVLNFLHNTNDMHIWVSGILFALSGLLLYLSYVQLKRLENR